MSNNIIKDSSHNDINNNLSNIIKQVSDCNEFKDIMKNISGKLQEFDIIKSNNIDEESFDSTSRQSIEENNNLDDYMTSYFLSKNGDNICDCVDKLNKNLEKIIDIINKK